jgi:hypothetical protein
VEAAARSLWRPPRGSRVAMRLSPASPSWAGRRSAGSPVTAGRPWDTGLSNPGHRAGQPKSGHPPAPGGLSGGHRLPHPARPRQSSAAESGRRPLDRALRQLPTRGTHWGRQDLRGLRVGPAGLSGRLLRALSATPPAALGTGPGPRGCRAGRLNWKSPLPRIRRRVL